MIILPKENFWPKIVEHYYEHEWKNGESNIIKWLNDTYNAETDRFKDHFIFKNNEDLTIFILRWI